MPDVTGVLDPKSWKVTLPIGKAGKPTEHTDIAALAGSEWLRRDGDGLRFRAAVNGVTTSGSKYPRCELREMNGDGDLAGWSTTSGYHRMEWEAAFTALPTGKPHVVGAQVHGGDDDVTVWRLEGNQLYITDGDDSRHKLIDPDYRLGTRYRGRIDTNPNGVILHYYNGALVATVAARKTFCFFKIGAYVQANCANAAPCSGTNYGETVLYRAEITHSLPGPAPAPQPVPPAEDPLQRAWPELAHQLDNIRTRLSELEGKLS